MFDRFEQVEAKYNNTKPVVSKNHTREQDVRPLHKRRIKWERIEKIDSDTYALWCGYTDGDDVFSFMRHPEFTKAEKIALAPIVWRRLPNGDETVKLRGPFHGYATGYYRLLKDYVPLGLNVVNTQPGQWHVVPDIGKHRGDKFLMAHPLNISAYAQNYSARVFATRNDMGSVDGRDTSLTFVRRKDHGWHPADDFTKGARKRLAKRVDKERKAALKPKFDALWDWFVAIQPLLPDAHNRAWSSDSPYGQMLRDYREKVADHYGEQIRFRSITSSDEAMNDLLDEPDNPARMLLALQMSRELFRPVDHYRDPQTLAIVDVGPNQMQVRQRFNAKMNEYYKLTRKVEVDL